MEFTLYYRGPLKSNGGPKEKHALRVWFHGQLKELWKQLPLSQYQSLLKLDPDEHDLSVIRQLHGFNFAPLVSAKAAFVAELRISMLRPEPPGSIVTQGGDIDNRLKTLLDALKVPSDPSQLPKGAAPIPGEKYFFCLLDDDNLVTRLDVDTDRLLEPGISPSEVVLTIHVTTKQLLVFGSTVGLA
jgi:hypothetical protein